MDWTDYFYFPSSAWGNSCLKWACNHFHHITKLIILEQLPFSKYIEIHPQWRKMNVRDSFHIPLIWKGDGVVEEDEWLLMCYYCVFKHCNQTPMKRGHIAHRNRERRFAGNYWSLLVYFSENKKKFNDSQSVWTHANSLPCKTNEA